MKKHFAKLLFAVLALGLVLVAVGAWVVHATLQPVEPHSTTSQRFVIPKGQSTTRVASRLYDEGLIKHPLVFRVFMKFKHDGYVQAGSFELGSHQSVAEIADVLTSDTQDVWITLLEGWRREEMADYLVNREDLESFDKEEFLALTDGYEGRLFPDTYLVSRTIATRSLVDLLRYTFDQKVLVGLQVDPDNLSGRVGEVGLNFDEVLVLASLVEREARDFEQMRHVAGILLNRLEIGMPLQVDATLQYAKGFDQSRQTWWAPPRAADKSLDSAFNTYLHNGLPPQPIANPSLRAVQAVLDPLTVNDLYYLHAPDGQMYYGRTLEEHNRNINTYLRS